MSTTLSGSIVDQLHEDGNCISIQNIVKNRRQFDLACSLIGLMLSSLHLGILIYIRYWQKRKGFFLLLTQAAMSVLTLTFLVIGCLIDICMIKLNKGWIIFRAYVWLFAVNSLIAAYGFLNITLCIDRYVALNKPLYYRLVFVRLRVRIGLVVFCCVLGMICCIKWAVFNQITPDGDYEENVNVTGNAWYVSFRIGSTVVQFFVSGILMLVLSYWNVRKLHQLDKAHFQELRMSDIQRNQWTKDHKTIAKICIFLAISFCVFNWPYALTDYFYTDELIQQTWYATIELIINLCQRQNVDSKQKGRERPKAKNFIRRQRKCHAHRNDKGHTKEVRRIPEFHLTPKKRHAHTVNIFFGFLHSCLYESVTYQKVLRIAALLKNSFHYHTFEM